MKSIGLKLWSAIMLLVGIIILLLWLFQIVFLDQFYSNIEISENMKYGNSIIIDIKKLERIEDISDTPDILQQLDNFVYTKQLSLEIIDASGNSIYQSASSDNNASPGMLKEAVNEAIDRAQLGEEVKIEVTHPKFGSKFMIIGLPIILKNDVQGVMVLKVAMAPVEDTVGILQRQLIIIIGIIFVVSIFVSYLLSKKFTKPILDLNRLAENFAQGKFETRVKNTSKDEIGRLADRMNQMGQELSKNEKLQKELIANVSHELRTPLTLIRGYAETLRDVTGSFPDKREKQLGVIIDESERLGNIVEDILSLSQLQAGAVTFEISPFSLNEMMADIMVRYELQVGVGHFTIHGVQELNCYLLGDKRRMEQVIYNLLNNAFRHTRDEDFVEFNVFEMQDNVRLEVKDTGEGIEKEDLEHIFERYYKGKRSDGKKTSGTGLGLAIVKNILDMHQAPYGVESVLGEGTTFWFELMKANSHTSF